ncbi:MAG: hypothetical protein Pg6B_08870 [Candidatus Azobacteroides pseudotrichonymphae]|nr:MAG: hypothetical protein Pg6B_08870 [Candidatus Azobacteroides pseudotrichonymphae]
MEEPLEEPNSFNYLYPKIGDDETDQFQFE